MHPLIQPNPNDRAQQRTCVLVLQTLDLELWKPPKLLTWLACGEHQPNALGQKPPRHERQRLRGRLIQPLRVIDHTQKRPFLRCFREQGQRRQPDQEPIGRTPATQPERDPKRVTLRSRKPLKAIEQRRAQLVKAGEGQLHL